MQKLLQRDFSFEHGTSLNAQWWIKYYQSWSSSWYGKYFGMFVLTVICHLTIELLCQTGHPIAKPARESQGASMLMILVCY